MIKNDPNNRNRLWFLGGLLIANYNFNMREVFRKLPVKDAVNDITSTAELQEDGRS